MPKFRKTNDTIPRKHSDRWKDGWKDRWKDGETLFHKTLLANAGAPMNKNLDRLALLYEIIS